MCIILRTRVKMRANMFFEKLARFIRRPHYNHISPSNHGPYAFFAYRTLGTCAYFSYSCKRSRIICYLHVLLFPCSPYLFRLSEETKKYYLAHVSTGLLQSPDSHNNTNNYVDMRTLAHSRQYRYSLCSDIVCAARGLCYAMLLIEQAHQRVPTTG